MILPKGKFVKGLLLFLISISSSAAFSAQINLFGQPYCFHGIFTLLGGFESMNPINNNDAYIGTDDDVFTYNYGSQAVNSGFIGGFLGIEWPLWNPALSMQAGVEYDYYGSVHVYGVNGVGIEPETSTYYDFRYRLRTQQVMAVAKLLGNVYCILHPYASVGIGAAFNNAYEFSAETSQRGSVNVAPTFGSNTQTSFTYSVGVGVDVDVLPSVRLGLGYRFSDFGQSSLGNGTVSVGDYHAGVPFSPGSSHTYVNQLVVDLSYVA